MEEGTWDPVVAAAAGEQVRAADDDSRGAADAELARVSEELARTTNERAGHRTAMNRLDAHLKSLARQAQSKEAAATRATDPTQQGMLRGEVSAVHAQVAALEPELQKFAQKAAELDGPIAELEAQVTAARERASTLRRDLGEASRVHQGAIAEIAGQIEAESKRITASERELSLKFVTLGTLLNLNRVQNPSFEPLYREFDELKHSSGERDAEIARLELEIKSYDRRQFQKGVIVIGVTTLVLLMIIAIVG